MKTIALWFESTNIFHIGHLNILRKAQSIFGNHNVIVAMGVNPDKSGSDPIKDVIKNEMDCHDLSQKIGVNVITYSSFMHDLVILYEKMEHNVVIVRGLRNGNDLDYEMNQMRFVHDFKKDVKVVYITCDKEFEHVSSSSINKIENFGGSEMVKRYTDLKF